MAHRFSVEGYRFSNERSGAEHFVCHIPFVQHIAKAGRRTKRGAFFSDRMAAAAQSTIQIGRYYMQRFKSALAQCIAESR
ncbi:hypothetical protein [Ferrovibrio sp.]|uniref:hypothetical protein n=1 Tax=Ferrovibrio sp. TaxID=1917215 RepID=UPI0025C368A8|nr:hypothetical protein [Ferrovibrio sp.]